jgi:hypothetical protein
MVLAAGSSGCAIAAASAPEPPRQAPRVFSAVEVVRKTQHGYLVTPAALIPFAAEVRADHALKSLAYVVTAARFESGAKVGQEGKELTAPVSGFTQRLRQRNVREFHIAADDASSALDLAKLPHLFREPDADQPPSRYRLRIWLEATDNDVDTGPRTGRSEPVTFVVVPELELLSEIAKEEELLQLTLEDRAAERVRMARFDLQKLNDRLAVATADQISHLYGRAVDIADAVNRASEYVQDIHTDFRRIIRELRANRVRADMIDRVEKSVCGPLDEALRREFPRSAKALAELCKRLEGDNTDQARKDGAAADVQLDALVSRVGELVEATRKLGDVNRLIRMLLNTQQNTDRLLRDRQ